MLLSVQEVHAPPLWSFVKDSPAQQTCSVCALVLQLPLSANVSVRN